VGTPVVAVLDEDFLLRRLSILGHFNPDGTINSNAFKKDGRPDPQISVDLARMATVREALSRAPNDKFKIGIIQVRPVRELGLVVRHQPTPENPSHTIIEGNNSRATCRELARLTWLSTLENI